MKVSTLLFDIKSNQQKVIDGYSIASEILCGPEILERIGDIRKLTYTDHSVKQFADAFSFHTEAIVSGIVPRISVEDYFYKSSSVVATTYSDKRGIFVNKYNFKRFPIKTYLGNGAHEFGHSPMGYGHGSNWTQDTFKGRAMCKLMGDFADKNHSVPNILEALVEKIAIEKKLIK